MRKKILTQMLYYNVYTKMIYFIYVDVNKVLYKLHMIFFHNNDIFYLY